MTNSERQLTEALRRRQPKAYAEAIRTCGPQMQALAVRLLGSRQEAEEAVEDAFLQAFSRIGSFEGRSSLQTWLNAIALHCAASRLRRRKLPTVPLDGPGAQALGQWLDSRAAADFHRADSAADTAADQAARLSRAIAQLTADEQLLVRLFYYDDLPLKDIATALAATPGALAKRLVRIRTKLYKLIRP